MARLTHSAISKFLSVLATGSSVTEAANSIGISRQSMYVARERDEEFRARWDDAVEQGTDLLEDVALKRAQGSSDHLLIMLLKARRRDKFGDRSQVENKTTINGQMTINAWLESINGKSLGPPSERDKS
jgi:hypothetical protein